MIIKTHINVISNKYFFIQNLSQWHFSNSEHYNNHWIKITGKLNKKEICSLQEFAKMHKKYSFDNQYLGDYFFSNSKKLIFDKLTSGDKKILQNTFLIFEDRFQSIWKQDRNKLIKWNKIIKQTINKEWFLQTEKQICNFFHFPSKAGSTYDCFMLLSAPNWSGGGANLKNKNAITLEISGIQHNSSHKIILTILHEITHIRLKKYNYTSNMIDHWLQNHKQAKEKIKNYRPNCSLISNILEICIRSLVPSGCLNPDWKKINHEYEQEIVIDAMNLSKQYIARNKTIDNDYLEILLQKKSPV